LTEYLSLGSDIGGSIYGVGVSSSGNVTDEVDPNELPHPFAQDVIVYVQITSCLRTGEAPGEQTDEAPGLIENVEREIPIEDEDNESAERGEPRDQSDPPLLED
jgi:hypothetical protein